MRNKKIAFVLSLCIILSSIFVSNNLHPNFSNSISVLNDMDTDYAPQK